MLPSFKRPRIALAVTTLLAMTMLAGCNRSQETATASLPTAGTVPPPPGDSTPKPVDSDTRKAVEGNNEKTGASSTQSTVGTAASGAPPYTMNGAPEGNAAPQQGAKAGEPAKK